MDRKGVVVNLPFDLLTGYARYVSRVGITNASRFSIDKVYREKIPRKIIGGALQAASSAVSVGTGVQVSATEGGLGRSGLPPSGAADVGGFGDDLLDVSQTVQQQMQHKWGGVHPLMCTEAVYDVIREDIRPTPIVAGVANPSSSDRSAESDKDKELRRVNSSAFYAPSRANNSSPRNSTSLFVGSRTSTPSPQSHLHMSVPLGHSSLTDGIDWEKTGFVESDVLLAAVEVVSGVDPTGKSSL